MEPDGSSIPRPLNRSCRHRRGFLCPAFPHPAPSAIRHPAGGGSRALAAGTGRTGRAGRRASCGSRGSGGGWERMWQRGGGSHGTKRAAPRCGAPPVAAPEPCGACGAVLERAGALWLTMDGGWCSASRGQPRDPASPAAPVSSMLLAGGCWVGAWGGVSILVNYPAGTRHCKTSGDAGRDVLGTVAFQQSPVALSLSLLEGDMVLFVRAALLAARPCVTAR